jgi:hypothetical protein
MQRNYLPSLCRRYFLLFKDETPPAFIACIDQPLNADTGLPALD